MDRTTIFATAIREALELDSAATDADCVLVAHRVIADLHRLYHTHAVLSGVVRAQERELTRRGVVGRRVRTLHRKTGT